MKKWLFALAVMVSSIVRANFQEGIELAKQNKNIQAAKSFTVILKKHPNDPIALYNLGVLAQKSDKYVLAIYYFERAIKFRPGLKEAESALMLCHKKLKNDYLPEAPFSTWEGNVLRAGQFTWRLCFLSSSTLLAVMFFLWLTNNKRRKMYGSSAILLIVLLLVFGFMAWKHKELSFKFTHAIVMQPMQSVFSTANGNALISKTLYAGQRLRIFESRGSRLAFQTTTGKLFWIDQDALKLY